MGTYGELSEDDFEYLRKKSLQTTFTIGDEKDKMQLL